MNAAHTEKQIYTGKHIVRNKAGALIKNRRHNLVHVYPNVTSVNQKISNAFFFFFCKFLTPLLISRRDDDRDC